MKKCSKLYKLKNGRPLESISNEDWYKKIHKDDYDKCFDKNESYFRNISTLRNHLPELDNYNWDNFNVKDFTDELLQKC